ncbi:LuxR C-terminal-related transcriptional regulator [Pelagihabitans pacificus]|nr:LuxR C-terminal-related transcriptional regulator [Pelagihabitans pacificus]
MVRLAFVVVILLGGFQLAAQTHISGHLDLEAVSIPNGHVYLSRVALEDLSDNGQETPIARSAVDENGFFSFKKLKITDKDAIYRIYIEQVENALRRTLRTEQLFIFSRNDSIYFKRSGIPFADYTNTNIADREWRRLRRYETALRAVEVKKEDSLSSAYVLNLKSYAKDSLQILMVKLIGIKQLDYQQLLEKDIAKNPDYYLALLSELKKSDIDRGEYLFLENKLAFLTTEIAERRYRTSAIVNIILCMLLVALLVMTFRIRSSGKLPPLNDLSKQEQNVQQLILQGKSNKQIAEELFISLSTVKTHITNIYNKLQVSGRKELLQRHQN